MEEAAALYEIFQQCTAVSTDSRQPQDNTLFFALNGPTFRGRDFAPQALAQGARHAVVDDAALAATDPARYTYAPDALVALQQLANYHRRQLIIPIIGITGSNGKTTTKELIYAVLSQRYRVQYTQGNLNNHIGVPLTLLSIRRGEHEMAIVEMGANHQGEIALLSHLAEPTHGLITNIGKAHLEGFGGVAGIAKGKSELFRFLAKVGGTAFVNTADPLLPGLSAQVEHRVTYPNPTDTYPAKLLSAAPQVMLRLFDGTQVAAQITGGYNFLNLAAAAAVGAYFQVPAADIATALAGYAPTNNRSQLVRTARNEVVLDAYNANPSSMAAAVASFAARPTPAAEKVVILGDMFELGEESAAEHRALGELLAAQHFGTVLLCGSDMRHAAAAHPAAHYFATKVELTAWLQAQPLSHRQILVKGSRGMGLETVLSLI
ncbi:UDP-N-acetylmuramoyl-tripeptide--D-alanyl-D-alanine ligase [Hymenobacter daecheongensis DSM 21074]|uniref:UDP-N-acetylmuramoyl-tripeptide--D-alanyl-D-alanine ligase n=1 Tax=Hymenobacter daecheongensis DSM 21074 TaxID=1121955 RepID=A0A1M6L9P0_9BACT|nr:UDP-N-acetylmuramoyl-tripeptide--D-alanyl-D-alanine ligase [Hymenobacter daecheongensis]SHJ67884.1 UDP-N-acetylmuramoyl-tripeptide--D-alanyl-D-alanine ligase [Hymenobacter daecheongensis DSM 21074]